MLMLHINGSKVLSYTVYVAGGIEERSDMDDLG